MTGDVNSNAVGSDPSQPAKRTSVVNMWRQKEQDMLAKQGAPKPAPSPARRSFKFDEKKVDATSGNSKIKVQSSFNKTEVSHSSSNAVNSWKKPGSFKSSQPTANSSSGDDHAATREATREAEAVPKVNSAEAVPKVDSNEGSTSERTKKNKFAMMGQKHAARPKKLANYSSYQQQAEKANGNPLSPVSMDSAMDSAALSEAFDDVVPDEQGEKLSAELSSKRRAPQSEGLKDPSISRQSYAAKASEYSSLQVSDSASIPHDVNGGSAQKRYYAAESDPKDDDSLISGLSSPGTPSRSVRQQRQNRRSNLESPREEEPKASAAELSVGGSHGASFDSEGFSTVTSAMTGANSAMTGATPSRRSRPKAGLDQVSEAVITDEFVSESDTNVSAFQDAVQKMSLADLANDMKEEARNVFKNVSMDKLSNDFNDRMVAAQQSFNRLVKGGNNNVIEKGGPNEAENNEGEPKEGEQHATEQQDGEQREGYQKEGEQNEAKTEPEQTEPVPKEPESSMSVAVAAPHAPKKVLTLPKRQAAPVQEEVAIEVEYLEESDDEEADL